MMHRLIAMLCAIAVVGCVDRLAARQTELSRWVGQPEANLIQRMGVPNRTYETGGMKYLAYLESRQEIIPSAPMYPPGFGWYGAGGFPPQVLNLTCETTFTIGEGIIRAFSLRGNACG